MSYSYTFAERGRKVTEASKCAGSAQRRAIYSYDAVGILIAEDRDFQDDGTVNLRVKYSYDDFGNKLTEEEDHAADGTVDERRTQTYACP